MVQIEKRDPALMQDYGRDPQFADGSIDAMREQKLAVSGSCIDSKEFISKSIASFSSI